MSILAVLTVCACASMLLAALVGSAALPASALPGALVDIVRGKPATLAATLLQLRLDRALAAFSTGAMLALAGAMMQALLRNPLADPYVLGVSGGAAVGALTAMLFAGTAWLVDAGAFAGALTVASLLFLLAWRDLRGSGEGDAPTLLLTGVIIGSGCAALVALLLSIAPEQRLRGMVFWLIGDLSATPLRALPWVILVLALLFALRSARALNIAALHADLAATLGIRVGRLRQGLFLCAALLTAGAVSNAGSIGFVGLIVPHACRLAWGPDHRLLLPAAALAGGSFLVLADTLARSIAAPQQLPVGVVTALIGVPVFLLQLHRVRRG
jgi:iron complex transport system permease protein